MGNDEKKGNGTCSFYASIAGDVFHVHCQHTRAVRQLRPYKMTLEERAVVRQLIASGQMTLEQIAEIYATEEEIAAARENFLQNRETEASTVIDRSDSEFENVVLMHKIADVLAARGILLMHGSAVVVDGKAYLFTARSGTGKSTHVQLWLAKFGERAYILNDDRPFITMQDEGAVVYSSPWMGKHNRGTPGHAALVGIAEIIRSTDNRIEPIGAMEAFHVLRTHCYDPMRQELTAGILNMQRNVAENVRCYRLYCNMEPEAADAAYEVMGQR